MALEIERKFLVIGDGWRNGARIRTIAQAYLTPPGPTSVRVRIQDGRATLTIKGESRGAVRDEFEYPLPLDDAEAMMTLCQRQPIRKKRHEVLHAGKLWQVDVFEGALTGLVVAEIELSKADEAFALPDWIGREVTDDPRYRNSTLIASGLAGLGADAPRSACVPA
ncbi:CYTH domain-containing protein [Phreatobacter sp.]|uniref:CYTH domain-containing protein n=1 Tax=Phreatobacter sp. TaxID=1966341 RepID=UPI0022C53177|nr:CYTH domain-containing protein [Phreatobacter sp.]MCZ8315555.1 CYTH domain-containing protein [Phreatobacter sp.]